MNSKAITVETLDEGGCGLRLVVSRQQDRSIHQVFVIQGQTSLPLIQSVEGQPSQRWPPSPPLQQIHFQTDSNGTQTVFLVGMAGSSHWSLSIQATQSPSALLFDAACRLVEPAGWLGSTYQSPADAQTIAQAASCLITHDCHLQLLQGHGAEAHLSLVDQLLKICAQPTSSQLPTTVQWKYRLVYQPDAKRTF